jgi:alkylation response protein AidB-like acyl-CoA dehydrogenase
VAPSDLDPLAVTQLTSNAPAARARALGTLLRARSAEIERARRLPDDIVSSLQEAGLFRLFVPRRYGGEERSAREGFDVVEELAYHDGATGWCVMIGLTTSLLAGHLEPEHAELIYRDSLGVTGGFAAPVGRARFAGGGGEAGGIEVSGQWSWGSGIHHCTWFGGGCLLEGGEGGAGGRPRWIFAFVPIAEVEVLDTWYTAGLCGTGSTDYRIARAVVPAGRFVELGTELEPRESGPLYRLPTFGALAIGVAAVALGLARRALDELLLLAGVKKPAGSTRSLAERPATQAEVARAEAGLLAARALWERALDDAWRTACQDRGGRQGGRGPELEERRMLRLAATHATLAAAETIDRLYHLAGGTAVYLSSPLQRVFRDVHVATQHAMVAARTYELVGRLRLGLATETDQL